MWFHRRESVTGEMESKAALYLARQHLAEVKARGPEVNAVVEATVEFRRKNHFAEDLTSLMKGAISR